MGLAAENKRLREEIDNLRQRIKELEALLGQNSRNSNWPSSRDKSRKKKKNTRSLRRKSNKKAGGQAGHQGHTLEMRADPDHVCLHRPGQCVHCQTPFEPEQASVRITRRQVIDIPPIQVEVTEHRCETLRCTHCGQETSGMFPQDVTNPVQYGSRIKQTGVYLKTEQLLPYDRTRQCMADLFQVQLSPGTLQNAVKKAAQRLEPVVEGIKEKIVASAVAHFDESGFYIGGQRHWLHSAGTELFVFYFPHRSRGRKGTDAADILPRYRGTAIHDNWPTYWLYEACEHGLCNSHHLRELTAVEENDEQRWATRFKIFLLSAKQAVETAKEEGLEGLPPAKIGQIERIYERLMALALQANQPPEGGWPSGKRGRPKKTKPRNLAERLGKRQAAVLAFVYDFKVPFDNNLAERDIRMLKVQQKISGCFRSEEGAKDFCTIRSYISTMRKQSINVWEALGSVFAEQILIPSSRPPPI
jgi:transposase